MSLIIFVFEEISQEVSEKWLQFQAKPTSIEQAKVARIHQHRAQESVATTTMEKPVEIVDSKVLQPIRPLEAVEREAIENAIAVCEGNVPKAAAMLEVSPSTIYRKLQSWQQEA